MRTRKRLPIRRRSKNKRRKRTLGQKKNKYKGGVKDERLDDVDFTCKLDEEEEYPQFKETEIIDNVSKFKSKEIDLQINKIFYERSAGTNEKPVIVGTGSLTSHPGLEIYVKICPSYQEENYKALRYESCVYDKIEGLNMCNAVKKICTLEIKSSTVMFSLLNSYFTIDALSKVRDLYKKKYRKPAEVLEKDVTYFLLFTVKSGTMTLQSALQKKLILGELTLKSIIFQVAFSLCKLHKAGIQHNDLHLGNILIDTDAKGSIEYTVGLPNKNGIENVTFDVPINNCKILLYDWDLGYSNDCGENEYLVGNVCDDYGVCNGLNIKFDFYTFMRGFDKFMTNSLKPKFTKFRNEMITQSIDEKYDMRMCNVNKNKSPNNKKDCILFGKDEPIQVMSPYDALKNEYFNEFNREKNLIFDDEDTFSV
jgi:serine/threonine protein kinase